MSEANVFLEGNHLSVVVKPPRNYSNVIEARKRMLGIVDLDGLLSNLTTVRSFIRIAYNGVAGDTELQIMTRQFGLELAELCDDSGLTIGKFQITADSVLNDYIGAYQLLFDDMAMSSFESSSESVGDSAKEMEKSAQDFCTYFKDKREKFLEVCKSTAKRGLEGPDSVSKKQTLVDHHSAVGALANLATIMQKVAVFWKSMQQICKELTNGKFEVLLRTAQKEEDVKKRLKAYKSNPVKIRCVKMYISWVAMEWICEEYVEKTKIFCKDMYNYICEHPTHAESTHRMRLLCSEFTERIEQEDAKLREPVHALARKSQKK